MVKMKMMTKVTACAHWAQWLLVMKRKRGVAEMKIWICPLMYSWVLNEGGDWMETSEATLADEFGCATVKESAPAAATGMPSTSNVACAQDSYEERLKKKLASASPAAVGMTNTFA